MSMVLSMYTWQCRLSRDCMKVSRAEQRSGMMWTIVLGVGTGSVKTCSEKDMQAFPVQGEL